MGTEMVKSLQPDIVLGADGLNYDECLEHMFKEILSGDIVTYRDILLHNLNLYAFHLTEQRIGENLLILDDVEEAMQWASSISGIHVWKLKEEDKADLASRPDHEYGSYMDGFDEGAPVSGYNVHLAVLAAVVQRFREVIVDKINFKAPGNRRLLN